MPAGLAGMLPVLDRIWRANMISIAAVRDRLHRASGLTAILDAACDAFEDMLPVIWDHQDPSDGMFIPFVMAATCAANGRDAVLFAPSLPPRRHHPAATRETRRRSRPAASR